MYEHSAADVHFMNGEHQKALEMYFEMARRGVTRASFNYAYCLLRGFGAAVNYERAVEFFSYSKGIKGGEAEYNLAVMCMHGQGMKRDFNRVISLMRDSAELGCVEAQLYLGMAYTLGAVIEPEIISISLIPYHKPEYRFDESMLLAGDYADMEAEEEARMSVISADPREAFEWFRLAAHNDPTYAAELVARGQFMYAKCYLDGFGTQYNRDKGARLMLIAGKSGSQEAVQYLEANGHITQFLLEEKKERRYK